MTYGLFVISLAQQHRGCGWLAYDSKFRLQKAAGSTAPWTEVNTPLRALTVLANTGPPAEWSCSICYAADTSVPSKISMEIKMLPRTRPNHHQKPVATSAAASIRTPALACSASTNICATSASKQTTQRWTA